MMKKIFTFLTIFSLAFTFTSCEDEIETSSLKYISFSQSTEKVPVGYNEQSNVEYNFFSTKTTSSSRVFNVEILDTSTADTQFYTIPSTVTIPGGSNKGVITVEVNDGAWLDTDKTVDLRLSSEDESYYFGETLTLNIFRSCPFDINNFVGTYDALEDGQYNYEVIVEKGTQPNELVLTNLYDVGGTTNIILDLSDEVKPKVSFAPYGQGGVLYVHPTYGDLYAVNPSVFADYDDSKDTSALNSCDYSISLDFIRQVDAGVFSTIINVVMTKQ
ncbi:hypothetical protein [Tenacibaculum insulae]|uniref:hypothetical protein n=1 Tax=Tenacibaculum insulae TaxID=2029677 RepID=UPI003AB84A72